MSKERHGVHIVGETVEGELDWIFREQPSSDYGVDAHMEIKKEDIPTGLLIGIQIKAGESYFREASALGFIYRPSQAHVDYWTRHSMPIILVLVDLEARTCFWQSLSRKTIESTGKGWKVLVPRENVLSLSSKDRLLDLVAPFSSPLSQLQLAYPLMRLAYEEESFGLEAGRWINKTSGRSYVRLLAGKQEGEKVVMEWPYIILPGVEIIAFLKEAFPWANLELDEDFYLQYEEQRWEEEAGVRDDETDNYLFYNEGFSEWKERHGLKGVRPYETISSEVDAYRFTVTLNELGKAYMAVETYLRTVEEPWVMLGEPIK